MDKLKSLQIKLSSALLWNSLEAVLYQSILIIHQLALFWTLDQSLYGAQGALFASAFLGITVLNGSFDTAITPLFQEYCSSRKLFKSFLLNSFLSQIIFLFFGAFTLGLVISFFGPFAKIKLLTSPFWIGLLALFIVSEGTKKNLRSILHLGFQNKTTASIEVFNILIYSGSIWTLYFSGITFSLIFLTVPFVIVSLGTNLALGYLLKVYYTTLPDETNTPEMNLNKRLLQSRMYLYINEISRSVFSSNFLLPFFVYSGEFGKAGIATLINSLMHAVTFFIQKVFGPSGAALFANTKHLSFENKQSAFSYLNQKCFYALSSIFILFGLNAPQLLYFKIGSQSLYTWSLIYLFFLSHFLENIFIVYEKLFVAEEKAHYITLCNLISFTASIITAYVLSSSSLILILLCCMIMRLFAFLGLAYFAQKLWNLKFNFTLSPLQFSAPFVFSSFLFLLLRSIG